MVLWLQREARFLKNRLPVLDRTSGRKRGDPWVSAPDPGRETLGDSFKQLLEPFRGNLC